MTTGADSKASDRPPARRGGVRILSDALGPVTRRVLGRHSLAEATLLADWPAIVGEEVAARCRPRHLRFPRRDSRREGTLTLRVQPGAQARLTHQEPILVERVNAFFGYRAVARLRLEHAPLDTARNAEPTPAARSPAAGNSEEVARKVADVADPELRAALERLGRALASGKGP